MVRSKSRRLGVLEQRSGITKRANVQLLILGLCRYLFSDGHSSNSIYKLVGIAHKLVAPRYPLTG